MSGPKPGLKNIAQVQFSMGHPMNLSFSMLQSSTYVFAIQTDGYDQPIIEARAHSLIVQKSMIFIKKFTSRVDKLSWTHDMDVHEL